MTLDGIMKAIDDYTEAVVAKGSHLYNAEVCEMRKQLVSNLEEFYKIGFNEGWDDSVAFYGVDLE